MEEEKQVTSATTSPSDAMTALLSNPEALGRIAAMIGNLTQSTDTPVSPLQPQQSSTPPPSDLPTGAVAASAPLPLDGLGAVLSNPAMMEKLPQIMAMLKPMLAASTPKGPTNAPPSSPELCRDHLLLALKPFLSPARCEAVDAIIRISKLGAVFQQLK